MLTDFGYIGLFVIIAICFALIILILPVVLRLIGVIPSRPNPMKNSTFECGMETFGKSWVQFNFRYYFYALMFIALDILVVFLYPWAVGLRVLGMGGFWVILIFIFIILIGYLYAWKKKVLEWK